MMVISTILYLTLFCVIDAFRSYTPLCKQLTGLQRKFVHTTKNARSPGSSIKSSMPVVARMTKLKHSLEESREFKESYVFKTTPDVVSVSVDVGGKIVSFETGKMGRQANGAAVARVGDTIVYATACYNPVAESVDFTPLKVDYFSRFSAVGKTVGSYLRRDCRGDESEILAARLIDRPIRPMIADGWQHDTQLLAWLLSYDKQNNPEPLAICAASAAMAISEIPTLSDIAAVEIGLIDNKFVVNPTKDEMVNSKLKMMVAGTKSAILMIEGSSQFVSEEQLMEAIVLARDNIAKLCQVIGELRVKAGKVKRIDLLKNLPSGLISSMNAIFGEDIQNALQIANKHKRGVAMSQIEEKIMRFFLQDRATRESQIDLFTTTPKATVSILQDEVDNIFEKADSGSPMVSLIDEDDELPSLDTTDATVNPVVSMEDEASELRNKPIENDLPFNEVDIQKATKLLISQKLREMILTTGKRSDGRGVEDIRPLSMEVGLLPGAHGSALFTRGETQALATATLGTKVMEAKYETVDEYSAKRFYLQYRFPPSSVGEVGRVGGLSRREVGHGNLAERALAPAIPNEEDFPYSIRAESLITESCGSSSMATVCGCSMAMLNAGVPLKSPIAGIAMGLMLGDKPEDEPIILSDILGLEDALGTMDFKVAGNEEGVTTFQLDIKSEGLTVDVLRRALNQARVGRQSILRQMNEVIQTPGPLSASVPKMLKFSIPQACIGKLIGPKGKTLAQLVDTHGLRNINVDDDGLVILDSDSQEKNDEAMKAIVKMIDECNDSDQSSSSSSRSVSETKKPAPNPTIGTIYKDCEIKGVHDFGIFVEVLPGFEALVHVSELSIDFLDRPSNGGFSLGQRLDVQCIGKNDRGQWRFSRKSILLREATSSAGNTARLFAPPTPNRFNPIQRQGQQQQQQQLLVQYQHGTSSRPVNQQQSWQQPRSPFQSNYNYNNAPSRNSGNRPGQQNSPVE